MVIIQIISWYLLQQLKLTSGIWFWPKLSQRLALGRLKESILFNILHLIGCMPWPIAPRKRGGPYVCSPTVILRCFIVRIWFKIDSNSALHTFLDMDCQYNRKLALACGLVTMPSRRTFDRRLKAISTDVKERISTMGHLFVIGELVGLSITAIDSTLIKANGHVWHKSSMKKGVVPRSGIDTDARWGYSHAKGWIFGYKLHLTPTTAVGNLVVPLTADVTTANVPDNKMYVTLKHRHHHHRYSFHQFYVIWQLTLDTILGNCTNTAKRHWEWIWFVR